QPYGFRVHGPWAPDQGVRCNPHKLLLDPYARAVIGPTHVGVEALPYQPDSNGEVMSDVDSARTVPHGVVVNGAFEWGDDRRPQRPWGDTVIYEMHVKGYSARRTDLPPEIRGTYAGLAHESSIAHLSALGITAVELLPVHAFLSESHLVDRGLTN